MLRRRHELLGLSTSARLPALATAAVAAAWVVLTITSLVVGAWGSQGTSAFIAIAMLALINMAALMSAAWWLRERRRQAHAWAILVLTANAALTLTDQMGWIDTLFLALTLAALVIVLIRTRWYWGRAARRAHRQGQRA